MSDLLLKMPMPFEPKRNNLWMIQFPTDIGIQQWTLLSAQRPQLQQSNVEMQFLNTSTFVSGRFVWQPISLTIRDAIGPSSAQAVMEWVRLQSESATGRKGYAAGYKKTLNLLMLDPTGVEIENWELQGCFLVDTVDFGSLSMDDDGVSTISMSIQYDRAILKY